MSNTTPTPPFGMEEQAQTQRNVTSDVMEFDQAWNQTEMPEGRKERNESTAQNGLPEHEDEDRNNQEDRANQGDRTHNLHYDSVPAITLSDSRGASSSAAYEKSHYREQQPFANQLPPSIPRQKPKRSTQPLHLLLQDCSRQYIVSVLCKKPEEQISNLLSDKKSLQADLKQFSDSEILTLAKQHILPELDEQGREALQDVSPENEIIKLRFDETDAVRRSFDDAMNELKFEYDRPEQRGRDGEDESTDSYPEGLQTVFHLFDISQRKNGPSDNINFDRSRSRIDRGGSRGRPRGRSGPPRHTPYHPRDPLPGGYGGYRDGSYDIPRDHRDYRRDRLNYEDYRERRLDDRRDYDRRGPPLPPEYRGPSLPGRGTNRERSPFDRGYPGRYDDRSSRRDFPGRYESREDRHGHPPPSQPRDYRGPPPPTGPAAGPPPPFGSSSSMKPSQSIYEAPPMPPQKPGPDSHYGYGSYADSSSVHQGYGEANSQAYYAQYPQDPNAANGYNGPSSQGQSYAGYSSNAPQYSGWGDPGTTVHQNYGPNTMPLQVVSFSSRDHGRHMSVPLPTDFMSGPSDAPRLSMPEPHQVLGSIHGVIIRDAQGNVGLSQYQFQAHGSSSSNQYQY